MEDSSIAFSFHPTSCPTMPDCCIVVHPAEVLRLVFGGAGVHVHIDLNGQVSALLSRNSHPPPFKINMQLKPFSSSRRTLWCVPMFLGTDEAPCLQFSSFKLLSEEWLINHPASLSTAQQMLPGSPQACDRLTCSVQTRHELTWISSVVKHLKDKLNK